MSIKIPAITVDLDDNQIAAIEPMMKKVRAASDAGCPGMLCAQVFSTEMKVFRGYRPDVCGDSEELYRRCQKKCGRSPLLCLGSVSERGPN